MESKKQALLAPKVDTAPSTTGPQTRTHLGFPMLSPDDPIFSRGFVVGSKRSMPSSPTIPAKASPSESKKSDEQSAKDD